MKKLLTLSRTLAVPLAMGCWTAVSAQSLGTPAADLWVGQPLQMHVPASFVEGAGGGECVHADVFYGDSRVQANRVRATVTGPQEARRVRIEADVPIDEPVVTVSLRAGCRNSVTRSYTLLPEIPSEAVLTALMKSQGPALVTAASPLPLRLAQAAAPVDSRARAPGATRAPAQAGDAAPVHLRAATRAEGEPAHPVVARAHRRHAAVRGAHLRVEPIDIPAEGFLRVSSTLAQPDGDASRRATAALLWQAINADPQDLLRTSAMLQKLEGDLAQLRQAAGATHSEMRALRERIEQQQAQPWYASTMTIQVLALLVLSAAAAAGVVWWRTRGLVLARQPWYERAPRVEPEAAAAASPAPVLLAEEGPPQPAGPRAEAVPAPSTKPLPAADVQAAPAQPTEPLLDFELPRTAAARSTGVLRVETLAATFEEVEFLSSLGLSADAMDVLTAYLQDSTGPAPLAYFEFMRLCEQAEDPQALATVRRRYTRTFGAPAPTLEQVTAAAGIDTLASLAARITRTWGTAEVLDVIAQALFTVPPPDAVLTLQAGRELLVLHELATSMLAEAGAAQASTMTADAHPVAPWANADDPAAAEALAQAIADADGGRHFALDVDLDAAPASLPETEGISPELELELAPLIVEMEEAARREAAKREAERAQAAAEEAFSAAVALERAPASRY